MKKIFYLLLPILIVSCIGDDFVDDMVDPELRILNSIDTIALNEQYQFEARYFNNVGQQENAEVEWTSTDETIISIDDTGLATALSLGQTSIVSSTEVDGVIVQDSTLVTVGESTTQVIASISGEIVTTSFYTLEGDFTLTEDGDDLILEIADNYRASSSLPGLYLYMSNNRNSVDGAPEVGMVEVFSGAHSYRIENAGINDFNFLVYFCKPFNVKVGEAEL